MKRQTDEQTERTPDGETKPLLEALDEWRALAAPLEQLGFELTGFDPSYSFRLSSPDGVLGTTFQLPVPAVRILSKALTDPERAASTIRRHLAELPQERVTPVELNQVEIGLLTAALLLQSAALAQDSGNQ